MTVWIQHNSSVVILQQVILPYITQHEFCQPDHLKQRGSTPGEVPYAYNNFVVHYYDNHTKVQMTQVLIKGESTFTVMTRQFFNQFVKDKLTYQ